MYDRRYTPERISELQEGEIFVFGSNLAGAHGGGAARLAYERFGAVWGEGVGLDEKGKLERACYFQVSNLEFACDTEGVAMRFVSAYNPLPNGVNLECSR